MNGCGLRYRYKASASPDYGAWTPLLAVDSTENEVSDIIAGIVNSLATSYQIELSASDQLGDEHRIGFAVMTEAISFVLYDGVDGAAFGKYPELPHVVDIASHMTLRVRGNLVVDGERWQDLGLMSPLIPSSSPHGRHKDTGCYIKKENGNHVIIAFNAIFDQGTHITVNMDPVPEEYRPLRPASSICACENGMACCTAYPDGCIIIDWLKINTAQTTPVDWIDGYIDYYTE